MIATVITSLFLVAGVVGVVGQTEDAASPPLQIATFDIDASPPVGSMMAYDPVVKPAELPLRCRGIVLMGAGDPIVLCAVDWIGIANEGHDAFRDCLAGAAGTSRERVAVHALHQHDAPACDFLAELLLNEAGAANPGRFGGAFAREVLERLDVAVRAAVAKPQPWTHAGWGEAEVKQVASNRRILGPDAKVRATRWTATKDPALQAEPEGVIDPVASLLSFWNGEQPVAVLSYYACHPQSYYRTGIPSPDFPGIARFIRSQAVPDALHVHFNGAGGNIGAGKYNDGAKDNRMVLASRLADGMKQAWDTTKKFAVAPGDVAWKFESVALPPADHLDESALRQSLSTGADKADQLAWLLRCRSSHQIELGLLAVGDVAVLHMPGELFVEYQLAAKQLRPDGHVAMAAYGDYGPGYIGTARAYEEGGYETSPRVSNVAPAVEEILMQGMRRLVAPDSTRQQQ